jgi:hypothetical protein
MLLERVDFGRYFYHKDLMRALWQDVVCKATVDDHLSSLFAEWAKNKGTLERWHEMTDSARIQYHPVEILFNWKYRSFKTLGNLLEEYYYAPWNIASRSVRDVDFSRPLSHREFLSWEGIKVNNLNVHGKREKLILHIPTVRESDVIELDITSYIGVSFGAMHCYGKLKLPWPWWSPIGERNTSVSCNYEVPHEVELTTKVTRKDKKDFPASYEVYKVGDPYTGFHCEKDVIDKAILVCNTLFPGFRLHVQNGFREEKYDDKWLIGNKE